MLMQRVIEALREHGVEMEEEFDYGNEVVLIQVMQQAEYFRLLSLIAFQLNGQNGIVYNLNKNNGITYLTATN